MKITKQLSDQEFVIDLSEDWQQPKNTHIVVAHDYVNIFKKGIVSTVAPLGGMYGPHAGCSNIVKVDMNVQINIHDMVNMVLPSLKGHKYLEPEHASKTNYLYKDNSVTFYNNSGEKMISIYNDDGSVETIRYSTYCKLTGIKP
jgi:hypothetical protein